MANVGYIRVSSYGQNTDRQLAGVKLKEIFEEKASAKDIKRPVLQECLRYLRKGDTLHVHSMDRLARNLADLQQLVTGLTGRGVAVQFHKEHLTFTGEENPMATLLLQVMGAIAQFERALIKERQREGIAAAKANGKQVGAKPKLTHEQVAEIRQRVAGGAFKSDLAREYGVSRQTLYASLRAAGA
jgi:DNA invertase Pin-like site-specific DNA recombinase